MASNMRTHELPDCFLVWYNQFLLYTKDVIDHGEEICFQGWADYHYTGINKEDARKAKKWR